MKAIETKYKGYRFRSRLEARWAVFFDALGLQWEYEPQGFDLGFGELYLPDFWLPDLGAWIEIKGKQPTKFEIRKVEKLAFGTGNTVVLAVGLPESYEAENLQVFTWAFGDSSGGLEYLGRAWFVHDGTGLKIDSQDLRIDGKDFYADSAGERLFPEPVFDGAGMVGSDYYARACEAARAARFEFGESGVGRG